ncbi:hypothetical protein [Plesiomonas sp.]|uniref:hypothetical protein n=1 Tax=Plesiomonas sp. TaxID=2486279 RepID=UPI003F2DB6F3
MKKLLNKKKYLSVFDAAKYLTSVLEEPYSVADIYQLAIDRELIISVRLINSAYAVKVLKDKEELLGDPSISSDQTLGFDKQIHVLDGGVWDLALIGAEAHEIKLLQQRELEGPTPKYNYLNGFYLTQDDAVYKVLDSLPLVSNQYSRHALETRLVTLTRANQLNLEEVLSSPSYSTLSSLDSETIEELVMLVSALSEEDTDEGDDYIDYLRLEELSYQYVIRVSELNRFLRSPDDAKAEDEHKPIDPRERTTLLAIIGVLCKSKNINVEDRESASKIVNMFELEGMSIKQELVRDKLNDVPTAMESRKKTKSL